MLLIKATNVYNLILRKYALVDGSELLQDSLSNNASLNLKAFVALKYLTPKAILYYLNKYKSDKSQVSLKEAVIAHAISKNTKDLQWPENSTYEKIRDYVKSKYFKDVDDFSVINQQVNKSINQTFANAPYSDSISNAISGKFTKKPNSDVKQFVDFSGKEYENFYASLDLFYKNNAIKKLDELIDSCPSKELIDFKNTYVSLLPLISELTKLKTTEEKGNYLFDNIKRATPVKSATTKFRLFSKYAEELNENQILQLVTDLTPYFNYLKTKFIATEVPNQNASNPVAPADNNNGTYNSTNSNPESDIDYFSIFKNQYLNYLNTESVLNVPTESGGVMSNFPFSYIVSMISSTNKPNYIQSVSSAGGTFLYYLWANNFFNNFNKQKQPEFNDQARALVLKEALQKQSLLIDNFTTAVNKWLSETADKTLAAFPEQYAAQLGSIKQNPSFIQLQTDLGQQYRVAIKNYIVHMLNYQKSYYVSTGQGELIGISGEASQQEASSILGPDGKPINWGSVFEANAKTHIFNHIKLLLQQSAPTAFKIASDGNYKKAQEYFIGLLHKSGYCDIQGQAPNTSLYKNKINGLSPQIESLAKQAIAKI